MSASASQPTPALLFDTINAYQKTAAIKSAIELDLFTMVAKGKQTSEALAESCNTSERGIRILCDFLVGAGFLTKEKKKYGLTPDSAVFLDRESPAYFGSTIEFLLSPGLADGFKDLTAAVRQGGTVGSEGGTVAPEHPIWVQFARAMAPIAFLPAQVIVQVTGAESAGPQKVLDIAAGHGVYGITYAQKNPRAEITALDWPQVLEVAKENARAAGVIDRYRTIAGSAFEADFGSGYDVVLITNFLHHFDVPTNETFLKKVYNALSPGGRAVTLEFVPNEDRVSPQPAASFSLIMLSTTPSGDAYTFAEYESMFRNVGFKRSEFQQVPQSIQQMIISYK
jgi:ubiquinone/menaquinone biosynthesis C-methylase UbiE